VSEDLREGGSDSDGSVMSMQEVVTRSG
jgi:hypothetical protein